MKLRILTLSAFASLVAAGCATSQGTREDYFGYTNTPKFEEKKKTEYITLKQEETRPKKQWQNPLRSEENITFAADYDPYAPAYVPVMVPWWDRYDMWWGYNAPPVYVYHRYRPVAYYHSWYSPWYDYDPYSGYSCVSPAYYRYPSWRHSRPVIIYDPVPVREPEPKNTRRTWGVNRGDVVDDRASSSGNDLPGSRRKQSNSARSSNSSIPEFDQASSSRNTEIPVSRRGSDSRTSERSSNSSPAAKVSGGSSSASNSNSNSNSSSSKKSDELPVSRRGGR